ncbi:MAG: sporulation transcription factor Spo0A [Clostridia bacterium]|nr:sporulation transcription factor Spo0A [Clostridia bacterium]
MQKTVVVLQTNDEDVLSVVKGIEGQLTIVGKTCDCEEALQFVAQKKPDFIITSLMLKNSDGIYVIEQTKLLSPNTRCVVLSVVSHGELMQSALAAGAFYYMIKPANYQTLVQRMLSLEGYAVKNQQSFRFEWAKKAEDKSSTCLERTIDERISRIFIGIGIPPHIKGYGYLREGIKLVVTNPAIITSVTKQLYPSIGQKFGTSASKVERAIRHAIEVAWNKGRVESFNALFGVRAYSENEKPTNSEFIAVIADRLLLDGIQ